MSNLNYTDYLQIKTLLGSQALESEKKSALAHEEMLFIITHQTYELWFKQIIWELDSIIKLFSKNPVEDHDLSKIVHRVKRVNKIWGLCIEQIKILETMSPMEFLEFRNHLYPASGFQSAQFRLIENKLGLSNKNRKLHSGCPYHQFLKEEEAKEVMRVENEETSILKLVEKWLERTPYLKTENYDFWQDYQDSVKKMFNNEIKLIEDNEGLSQEEKAHSIKNIEASFTDFENFMNKERYNKNSDWTLSFESLQAALFIQLYPHEPKLQLANRLLEELVDLDESMTLWRSRHAQMALRMLGEKVGTGGSSGAAYLKEATDSHKVFKDFFKLTTYFISGSKLTRPAHL